MRSGNDDYGDVDDDADDEYGDDDDDTDCWAGELGFDSHEGQIVVWTAFFVEERVVQSTDTLQKAFGLSPKFQHNQIIAEFLFESRSLISPHSIS